MRIELWWGLHHMVGACSKVEALLLVLVLVLVLGRGGK